MQALERFWEHLATYSLDDLVMYSAQAYQSMVATYNAQYWPWSQAVALAAIVAMLVLVCRVSRQSTSVMLALLAVGCAWVGWAFFQQHYATLHWAANRFAGLFYAMALVLIAAGRGRYQGRAFTDAMGLPGVAGAGLVQVRRCLAHAVGRADARCYRVCGVACRLALP